MYHFLPGFDSVLAEPPHGVDPHLVFFFDSGNLERSGNGVKRIATHATVVNVDHHPSNSRFGDLNVIDPDASAVGQMVMGMLDHFGFDITPTIATNLYVALLTDTGGFRYANTSARAFTLAARLVAAGVEPWEMTERIYESQDEARVRLLGRALESLWLTPCGRVGVVELSDFPPVGGLE